MNILRRCLKAFSYLLALLVLLAIGLYAWVAIANWHDDPLSETSQLAMRYTAPTEEELEGNGYLILIGIDALDAGTPAADAEALGRQRLAREIERRRWVEQHGNQEEGMPATIGEQASSVGDDLLPPQLRCPKEETDCFAFYRSHAAELTPLSPAQRVAIARYAAAAESPRFSNPLPFYLQSNFPFFARHVRVQEIMLAQATLQWMNGQPEQAMRTVATSARLRERLATSSNSLISTMIALAMHYRELRWLSNALNHMTPDTPASVTSAMTSLLQTPPPNLHNALEGEKQFVASILLTQKNAPTSFSLPWEETAWWEPLVGKLLWLAYLPQQSTNLSINNLQQMQAIVSLPADQLEAAFDQHVKAVLKTCDIPWVGPRNAVGRCEFGIATPAYQAYPQRITDIDGYRRLVLLQQQALAQNIKAPDMPAWLEKSPPELRNPYTLQPMQWDAATSSLVYEGKERQPQNPDSSSTYRIRLFTTTP